MTDLYFTQWRCPYCATSLVLRESLQGDITGETCPHCDYTLTPFEQDKLLEPLRQAADKSIAPNTPGYEHTDIARLATVTLDEQSADCITQGFINS